VQDVDVEMDVEIQQGCAVCYKAKHCLEYAEGTGRCQAHALCCKLESMRRAGNGRASRAGFWELRSVQGYCFSGAPASLVIPGKSCHSHETDCTQVGCLIVVLFGVGVTK
jgi:hypothetical protein